MEQSPLRGKQNSKMPIISHPACVHPTDDTVIGRFSGEAQRALVARFNDLDLWGDFPTRKTRSY